MRIAILCGGRQRHGCLRFALIAAGIRSGDIVVTVPNTFIATTEAISQAGARPDFVDIDERTYNMDPGKFRAVFGEGVLVGFGGPSAPSTSERAIR